MKNCDDHNAQPHGSDELRRDAIMQALLLQRSAAVEHRERVGHSESRQTSVGGAYLSTLPPIAGPGMVEQAVRALRELLSNGSVDEICRLWSAVERCLTKEESEELRPHVFNRLFPGETVRRGQVRHGEATLGGI